MMKLIAVLFAAVLLSTCTVGRIIEIVSDIDDNDIYEIEEIDVKLFDGNFAEHVAKRPDIHLEVMTPYTNLNGIISYTIGARVPGL